MSAPSNPPPPPRPSQNLVPSPSANNSGVSTPNAQQAYTPSTPTSALLKSEVANEENTASSNPRLRSSIACVRCRRSKIKCLNSGPPSTCRACEHAGRDCVYPTPGSGEGSAKRDREGDGTERRRVRARKDKEAEGGASLDTTDAESSRARGTNKPAERLKKAFAPTSPGAEDDPLDPAILTPKVWREVFDLFQLHFSTDLPFLHEPTFIARLCENARSTGFDAEDPESIPGWEMLMLGMLSLTARFHPRLVELHCSPKEGRPKQEPVMASEYYAAALRHLVVGEKGIYIGQPNLEKVQAMLMLGLHEWGMCKGIKAWIHVGLAIRMAQAMGLQFEDGMDDEPWALSTAMRMEAAHLGVDVAGGTNGPENAFVDEECRRRTFWSCFVMDRYLSSGKYRPAMLTAEDVKLQLPASDRAFAFGQKVCTPGLVSGGYSGIERARTASAAGLSGPTIGQVDTNVPHEFGETEGILSRFVRMVEVWGKIAKWSCSGGRRTEKYAPWDDRSKFFQLREALSSFYEDMTRSFRLTASNIQAHLAQRTSSPFTLLHTVYSLCQIILHREYVPFVPLRCDKPTGPLDDMLGVESSDAPAGFWEDSARSMFKAGRDMMDLVQACQSRGSLVETPILGFGLYTVAFVGIYAMNFPHMDPHGYMCGKSGESTENAAGQQAARRALEMIGQMRSRLPMANNWFRTIHRVHRYYEKIINDYRANTRALAESSPLNRHKPQPHRQLSLREGGLGGGAEGFQLLEKTLKDFGTIEDEDIEPEKARNLKSAIVNGHRSDSQSPGTERSAHHTGWTAINSIVNSDRPSATPQPAPSSTYGAPVSDLRSEKPSQQPQAPLDPNNPQQRLLTSAGLYSPNSNPTGTASYSNPPYPRTPYSPTVSSAAPGVYPPTTASHSQLQPLHTPPIYPAQNSYIPSQPPSIYQQLSTAAAAVVPDDGTNTIVPAPAGDGKNEGLVWTQDMQDLWLQSLRKPLGGDDVAAFVDGTNCDQWAQQGWLSEVWNGVGIGSGG